MASNDGVLQTYDNLQNINIYVYAFTRAITTTTPSSQYLPAKNDNTAFPVGISFLVLRNPAQALWMQGSFNVCAHAVNFRRRYIVTSSLIGWAHTQFYDPVLSLFFVSVGCRESAVLCASILPVTRQPLADLGQHLSYLTGTQTHQLLLRIDWDIQAVTIITECALPGPLFCWQKLLGQVYIWRPLFYIGRN